MNSSPIFTDSRGREFKPPETKRRELGVWQKFALSVLIIVSPFAVMGAVTQIDLTANVKGVLPSGNGGTGTASALTGIVRGGSAYTASEISGDCATSGSNVITCTKTNGTTSPVNSAADQTLVTTASATGAWTSIPNCTTGALQYATSTHTFTCGTVLTGTFADAEVPTGLINGANTSYSLAHTPSPAASLTCYENGVEQRAAGADYTLATATITYGVAPPTGTTLVCNYRF